MAKTSQTYRKKWISISKKLKTPNKMVLKKSTLRYNLIKLFKVKCK